MRATPQATYFNNDGSTGTLQTRFKTQWQHMHVHPQTKKKQTNKNTHTHTHTSCAAFALSAWKCLYRSVCGQSRKPIIKANCFRVRVHVNALVRLNADGFWVGQTIRFYYALLWRVLTCPSRLANMPLDERLYTRQTTTSDTGLCSPFKPSGALNEHELQVWLIMLLQRTVPCRPRQL